MCMLSHFIRVWLFVTLWTCQAPLSMGFSREEYWRGSSWPKYQTCVYYVSCVGRQVFTTSTTWTLVQMLNCFFFQISWVTDVSLSHRKLILNLDSRQKMLSDPNTVLYLSTGISWVKENSNAMLGGSNFDMKSLQYHINMKQQSIIHFRLGVGMWATGSHCRFLSERNPAAAVGRVDGRHCVPGAEVYTLRRQGSSLAHLPLGPLCPA